MSNFVSLKWHTPISNERTDFKRHSSIEEPIPITSPVAFICNPDPEAAAANAANFEPLVDGLYAGGAAKYSPVANWAELNQIQNQVEKVAAKATALKQALARAAATCDDEWTGEHVNLYLPGNFGYMGVMLGLYDQPAA